MIPLAVGLGASALAGLASTAVNYYQNKKNVEAQSANLDYQKALQQKIFEREDSAVQRRQADLRAAGLNPFLASNQSAGAGSTVSTQAPQSDFKPNFQENVGAAVDMVNALESLKQQTLYTQYMKMQNERAEYDNLIDFGIMAPRYETGFDDQGNMYFRKTGDDYKYIDKNDPAQLAKTFAYRDRELGTASQSINYQSDIVRQNSMIQDFEHYKKMYGFDEQIQEARAKFAVSDKIEQYILDSIGAFTGISNSGRGWYDSYQKHNTPTRRRY